jgi:hypothetical protein
MSAGLHVYGVLPEPVSLPSALGLGIDDAAVRLLPGAGLAVLVSDCVAHPAARTRRNLAAHAAVLARVMTQADILPLRFGAVAPHPLALQAWLADNSGPLGIALELVAGCLELDIKASWREELVSADIIESDPVLSELRDRLRSRPATETYYERVELGRRVEAALATRRTMETAVILAALSHLAKRETELPARDDEIILSRAFLLRRQNRKPFEATLQALNDRERSRVDIRWAGPVPPCHFVDIPLDGLTESPAAPT